MIKANMAKNDIDQQHVYLISCPDNNAFILQKYQYHKIQQVVQYKSQKLL